MEFEQCQEILRARSDEADVLHTIEEERSIVCKAAMANPSGLDSLPRLANADLAADDLRLAKDALLDIIFRRPTALGDDGRHGC